MYARDLKPMTLVYILPIQVGVIDYDHSRDKKGDFLVIQRQDSLGLAKHLNP